MFKLYKNNSLNVIPWWTWTSKVYQRSECTTETTIGCPPLGRYSMYWQIWCGGPELACRPWVWLLWYNGFVHNVLPCLWPSCVASVALVTSSNYLHCNCAMVKNNRGLTRTLRSSVDNVFFFFLARETSAVTADPPQWPTGPGWRLHRLTVSSEPVAANLCFLLS